MNNIQITSNEEYVCINNQDYFLTFSDLRVSDGIDIIENILLLNDNIIKEDYDTLELMEFIEDYKDKNNIEGSYISTSFKDLGLSENHYNDYSIVNILSSNISIKDYDSRLKIIDLKEDSEFNLGQIIIINHALSPKLLIDIYKLCIKTKTEFFEKLRLPEHVREVVNKNDFLVIACNLPDECFNDEYIMDNGVDISQMTYEDNILNKDKLLDNIKESVYDNCLKIIEDSNLSSGILDYLESEGISIDDLVDTGLELCVGVDKTNTLKEQVRKQILNSLSDINVITLLMAAIRTEEDFQSNHLREVDVSDDPAYLYSDEVLGLAISNQIAGTKAQFNFVRYDTKKPGILSSLGPMIDDIIGGLIAGCMSKVFEE